MGHKHRKPWRGKEKKNKRRIIKTYENFPGANTSTDQMVSPYGGLIPQVRGKLMRAKYYGATIFVDHLSDSTYFHPMTEMNAQSTVDEKEAFECVLGSFEINTRRYHAENGFFYSALFKI